MKNKKKLLFGVGTRPNFIKMAPLYRAFKEDNNYSLKVLHTGQHYDFEMSASFFEDLNLPEPDFYLGVKERSEVRQVAIIMQEAEKILKEEKPDLVFVFGDVNSTLAITLSAVKLKLKTAHVEAGLRSFDRRMSEENNRIVVDSLSDFLFITEKSGMENLLKEGHEKDTLFFVGNTMIDTLVLIKPYIKKPDIPEPYILLTLHRPQNVDNRNKFEEILEAIRDATEGYRVLFPAHPRTLKNIKTFGLLGLVKGFDIRGPMRYREFISFMKHAKLVITDSGGAQEETTFLGVPCVTVRDNTERPITVELGTNVLAGTEHDRIKNAILTMLEKGKRGEIPPLWDGKASLRIKKIVEDVL